MLNKNLRCAICLLIGLGLWIVFFSFAHELPSVSITASYGSTHTISTFNEAKSEWDTHELRLLTANQEMDRLKYERDIIDAAISGNRTELKKFKTVTILVAGRKIGFAAAVNAMVDLLDNGDTYEMGLQRISKYASIRSQNSAIANAASDRDKFHAEYARRWQHKYSPSNPVPPKINESTQVSIPLLGADCANACGTFYYDSQSVSYYSGFSGGISAPLGSVPNYARSYHQTTCRGTASCGVDYWTCEGNESGGTARHQLRTCKIQGRQWNSGTSSYDTVTCNMKYRNCDNPGGRCFNGSSAGNHPHNDSPATTVTDNTPNCQDCTSHCSSPCSCSNSGTCNGTVSTPPPPSYHACGVHETSVSGDHSYQASCSSTNANGTCTGMGFYACSHSHSYLSTPSDNTPDCSYCTDGCSSCSSSGSDSYDPGCGHVFASYEAYEANPGSCVLYGCTITGCGENYWGCQGSHTEDFSCSNCDISLGRCVNVSSVRCYSCDELN